MKTHAALVATRHTSNAPEQEIKVLKFFVGKDFVRHFELYEKQQKISIYHLYPTLDQWIGKLAPDDVNPRSHGDECLGTPVAKLIEKTLKDQPEEFFLQNRGGTLIAESLKYDASSGEVEIILGDRMINGLADGATSDSVIHKVQKEAAKGRAFITLKPDEIPAFLKEARFHIEVIVGTSDRDRIGRLSYARNKSMAVKEWSMADFNGAFDWISGRLERDKGPFKGRIGYEENAGKDVTVLDVLSLLTLFHKEYSDGGTKAPTVAYSNKGRMDSRLKDVDHQAGYKALGSLLEDILKLHDYVHEKFIDTYKQLKPTGRPGRRNGIESKPTTLSLTGTKVTHEISGGLIFPLLASMRVLIEYDSSGKVRWKKDPFVFFERNRAVLMDRLLNIYEEAFGGNPNSVGKKKTAYTFLYDKAQNLLNEEMGSHLVR